MVKVTGTNKHGGLSGNIYVTKTSITDEANSSSNTILQYQFKEYVTWPGLIWSVRTEYTILLKNKTCLFWLHLLVYSTISITWQDGIIFQVELCMPSLHYFATLCKQRMCTCNNFVGTISNEIVKLSSPNTLREQFTVKQYRYITVTKGDKPCMRTQSCTWYVWPLEAARFLYNALTRHKKKMKQHRQQSDGEELLMYLLLGSE